MFRSVRLHGGTATLLWGYRTTAELRAWSIVKVQQQWILTATIVRVDAFQCTRGVAYRELIFEAPRAQGRWCWTVLDLTLGPTSLRASLGPPLQ